jgi:predicted dehydrogenase
MAASSTDAPPAIAVVGVGYMGTLHAEKLAELAGEGAARLAGVHDADPARAHEVARRLGVPALERLEDVASVARGACLAAPTGAHAPLALRLLEAGVDVLVEKPIATTRAEARALCETARARGRVLQVGHVERYSRAFRAIRPVLRRPRFIEVHRMGAYRGRATDVSVVLDLMIHDLDIVAELAGSSVARVEAIGVPVLSTTEDIANARLVFENGCTVNITASRVSLEPLRRIRLVQADAYVSIDFATQKITVVRRDGAPGGPVPPKISVETLVLDAGDALLAQDRAFATAVATRAEPAVSGEDGSRALDLALRIQESIPPLEDLAG